MRRHKRNAADSHAKALICYKLKLILPMLAEHNTIRSKSVVHQTLHYGHGAFLGTVRATNASSPE
jgi:hypothetical protein